MIDKVLESFTKAELIDGINLYMNHYVFLGNYEKRRFINILFEQKTQKLFNIYRKISAESGDVLEQLAEAGKAKDGEKYAELWLKYSETDKQAKSAYEKYDRVQNQWESIFPDLDNID